MNEHNECPCCPALRAQAEAVDNALREVGAPVTLPGQEGTLLPPDQIRRVAASRDHAWEVLRDVARIVHLDVQAPTNVGEAVALAKQIRERFRERYERTQAATHVFEYAATTYGHRDPEKLGNQIVAAQIALNTARKDMRLLQDACQRADDLSAERELLRREVADAEPIMRAALDTFGEHPGAWLADAIRGMKAERDEEARTVEGLSAQVGEMEARVSDLERTLSTTRYERDRARDALDAAHQEIAKLRAQLERDQELFQLLRR